MAERTKRINLVVSPAEYKALRSTAKNRGVTTTHLLREFIRLGMKYFQPGTTIVVHEAGAEGKTVYIA